MASYNSFPTIDLISMSALEHLEDALVIKPLCATDVTSEFNTKPNGYSVGSSVQFRTTPDYEVKTFSERSSDTTWARNDSETITAQDIRSSNRTMYIEKHYDVSVTLSSRELAMDFDNFSTEVIKPAMARLAAKIDTYVGTKILTASGLYASTSVLSTQADMALARKAALDYQLDESNLFCLVDSTLESTLLGSSWFNTSQYRNDDMGLTRGFMNDTMGFKFYVSRNFPTTTHLNSSTSGTTAASPSTTQNKIGTSYLIVGALASGKSVLAGDRILVSGCKRPLIAAADAAESATSITLVDPITEIIAASSAFTIVGGAAKTITPRGAIFDSKSLGICIPRLDAASGMENAVASANGISVRVVKGYNMSTKVTTLSMDCLVGAAALDPRRITLLGNAA